MHPLIFLMEEFIAVSTAEKSFRLYTQQRIISEIKVGMTMLFGLIRRTPVLSSVGGVHLWRSTNGGNTLTQISDGSGSAHADHHFIVTHPSFNNTSNRTVFFGNDGGIYRTSNVTTASINSGWTELNNNLGITQFYGAAGNSTSGVIIGGTQDNGTLKYNGGTENWTEMYGADGGFCAADQTDSNYFYGEKQNFGVIRSSNAGQSADFIADGITERDVGGDCQCNFIAPIALDPE